MVSFMVTVMALPSPTGSNVPPSAIGDSRAPTPATTATTARSMTSKARPARDQRIEIWRSEVAASPIFCVCSAPSVLYKTGSRITPDTPNSRQGSVSHSAASTLANSLSSLSASSSTRPNIPNQLEPIPVPAWTSGPDNSCPICGTRVDGSVQLYQLKDGVGLVRARRDGSGSSINGVSFSASGRRSVSRDKDSGGGLGKIVTKKSSRVFAPFRRALKKSTGSGGPSGTDADEARNTEMYKSLRYGDAAGDSDEDDSFNPDDVSADEGGRPKPALLETEARLRRAQKLLERSNLGT